MAEVTTNDTPFAVLQSGAMVVRGALMGANPTLRPNHIREVKINQLDHGYNIEVGCQKFAIETKEKLVKYLVLYLKDPQKTEKAWQEGKLKL
jgi:hypothetical protein